MVPKTRRIVEYILVFMMLIASSRAFDFVRGNVKMITLFNLIVILSYFFYNRRLPRNLVLVFGVFTFYFIVSTMIFGKFHFGFYYRIISLILVSAFIISLTGDRFINYFINIVYKLSFIGLIFFLFEVIAFGSFYNILHLVDNTLGLTSFKIDNYYYTNIIIYTINTTDFHRNCGFMFEPGPYAIILSFSIIFYLIVSNFNLKSHVFYVLLVSLLTTFSTTGYLSLFIILLFIYYNKSQNKKLLNLFVPIIIALFIYLFYSIPFLNDKINSLYENNSHILNSMSKYDSKHEKAMSLGRFAGLVIDIEDFKNNPIIGYGGDILESKESFKKWHVASVNGLSSYLAKFGVVMFILLFFNVYKTFKFIQLIYSYKHISFILIVFLITAFSFALLETYFFVMIQLFYLTFPELNVSKKFSYVP